MKISLIILGLLSAIFILKGKKLLLDPLNKCSQSEVTYDSKKHEGFQISVTKFSSRNKKNNRAVLLLPPTGGKNVIDEGYAYMFCKKGFDVVVLEGWTGDRGTDDYTLDFGVHQRYMTKTQKAIETALDNMEYDSIGTLGTSAGSINFSVALSKEFTKSKVKSFFSIVGGKPLCHVIARAGESGLEKVRQDRFDEFDFENMNEYQEKICSVIESTIPDRILSEIKFGVSMASKDTTVPFDLQQNLRNDWAAEESITLDTSHKGAVIRTYLFHRKKVLKFFTESL